jgi:hypothetical protein
MYVCCYNGCHGNSGKGFLAEVVLGGKFARELYCVF